MVGRSLLRLRVSGGAAQRMRDARRDPAERLMTADEVAERLALPVSWVRESTRSGAMLHVRPGRYVRFELAQVEAWLEECRQPHTALTETAAAGVPGMFVQAKAGHAHGSTTERYLHAHRTSYPDAAELA